jgi:hypothetical protein
MKAKPEEKEETKDQRRKVLGGSQGTISTGRKCWKRMNQGWKLEEPEGPKGLTVRLF